MDPNEIDDWVTPASDTVPAPAAKAAAPAINDWQKIDDWTTPDQPQEWSHLGQLKSAVTDIPSEVGQQYAGAAKNVGEAVTGNEQYEKELRDTSIFDPRPALRQLGRVGSGLASAGYLSTGVGPAIVGAARSLFGHPLAEAEHLTGQGIDWLTGKNTAATDNPQEMYQTAAENTETALGGMGRVPGAPAPNLLPGVVRRAITPMPTTPERIEAARIWREATGQQPPAGAVTGSKALQRTESTLGDAPMAFSAYSNTMRRNEEGFSRFVARSFGEPEDMVTPEALEATRDRLGNRFETAAQGMQIAHDADLGNELTNISADLMREGLPDADIRRITQQIDNVQNGFVTRSSGPALMDGDTYQSLTRRNTPLDRAMRDQNPNIAYYATRVRSALDDAMERTVDTAVKNAWIWGKVGGKAQARAIQLANAQNDLLDARRQWFNMLAAQSAADENGIVTPQRLRRALTGDADRKTSYALSRGDLAPVARAGNILFRGLPDSNTAQRGLITAIPSAIAGALVAGEPITGVALGAAAPGLTGRAILSRFVQPYLRNQRLAAPGGYPAIPYAPWYRFSPPNPRASAITQQRYPWLATGTPASIQRPLISGLLPAPTAPAGAEDDQQRKVGGRVKAPNVVPQTHVGRHSGHKESVAKGGGKDNLTNVALRTAYRAKRRADGGDVSDDDDGPAFATTPQSDAAKAFIDQGGLFNPAIAKPWTPADWKDAIERTKAAQWAKLGVRYNRGDYGRYLNGRPYFNDTDANSTYQYLYDTERGMEDRLAHPERYPDIQKKGDIENSPNFSKPRRPMHLADGGSPDDDTGPAIAPQSGLGTVGPAYANAVGKGLVAPASDFGGWLGELHKGAPFYPIDAIQKGGALAMAIAPPTRGEALAKAGADIAEELPRIANLEGTTAGTRAAVGTAPLDRSAYINAQDYSNRLRSAYIGDNGEKLASSREVPFSGDLPPVGSWRIDSVKGAYGHGIDRLENIPLDGLILPELSRDGVIDAMKQGDPERYAQWISDGKRPPPIEAVETEKGNIQVIDGHRRALAAKLAGHDSIEGWVSRSVPTPSGARDYHTGQPVMTGLTYEMLNDPGSSRIANPIRAYHGSPYDFDAFDPSKIGSGEGAQAYGHGFYFAEHEPVAKYYKSQGVVFNPSELKQIGQAVDWLRNGRKGDIGPEAYQWVDYGNSDLGRTATDAQIADHLAGSFQANNGKMYQVAIHADPQHMLDWDKPLNEQPQAVQDAFAKVQSSSVKSGQSFGGNGTLVNEGGQWWLKIGDKKFRMSQKEIDRMGGEGQFDPGMMASQAHQGLANALGGDAQAAEHLRRAGIPGIRYLDQGSRGAGEGTRNYAVFDPSIIEILRKYGILGPVVGGAALQSQNQKAKGGRVTARQTRVAKALAKLDA